MIIIMTHWFFKDALAMKILIGTYKSGLVLRGHLGAQKHYIKQPERFLLYQDHGLMIDQS